jgi:zinc protease
MVDARVVFDAGSTRDGKLPGLARFTNGVMTDGAGSWNADQIAERLESVGAELGNGAARDMAWVTIRSLKEKRALDTAVETLATILAKPTFAKEDLERNRQAMLAGLRREEQSPGSIGKKRFMQELYGSHPYAIHGGGTQASVSAMGAADLRAFHQRYYVAKNALIAIVGALDRKEASALAERITRALPAGERATKIAPVAEITKQKKVDHSFPSSQSHIFVGQPGVRRGDPDYFPLYVGNHVLGGSGFGSLLVKEVREERGLSYSVYSYFSPMRDRGPFMMGAQTQNAKRDQALQVMDETLRKFIQQGPTEKQLTASKQNITGGFPLKIASNSKIVEYIAMLGFYDLPVDYLDTLVDKVNAVTREQIRDAFQRRVHPDRMVTVVVGNSEQGKK